MKACLNVMNPYNEAVLRCRIKAASFRAGVKEARLSGDRAEGNFPNLCDNETHMLVFFIFHIQPVLADSRPQICQQMALLTPSS